MPDGFPMISFEAAKIRERDASPNLKSRPQSGRVSGVVTRSFHAPRITSERIAKMWRFVVSVWPLARRRFGQGW